MAIFPGTAGNDIYPGTTADDTINGLAGDDELRGDAGNDTIDGGDDYDTIYGDAGNDTIYGGNGNDTIQGGLGQDYLDGGAGFDRVDYTTFNGNATYDLGLGTANLGVFTETMLNFESISAGGGNDTIIGTSVKNGLFGGAGNDTIVGGAGNDYIQGGLGQDTLDGGADVDVVDYTTFNGNATYDLGLGTANLGVFTETMLNFESIYAGGGNDTITGTSVDNSLLGGGGNDTIFGGAGSDSIFGDAGDDTIQGGAGLDYLYGGAGIDTVDYTTFNGGGSYNLATGFANLTGAFIETMNSFENIKTGNGDDLITGTTGDNKIYGGAGNDTILAGDGNDYVQGGLGQDYLNGGAGLDIADYTTFSGDGIYVLGIQNYGPNEPVIPEGSSNGTATLSVFTETMDNFEGILAGPGNDSISFQYGYGGTIDGGAGNDTIRGGDNGSGTIYGGDGDDRIYTGYPSQNRIYGGAGNDTIYIGYYGRSEITGGTGNDRFVWTQTDSFLTINDFTKGEDKLILNTTFDGISNNSGTLDVSLFAIVLNDSDVEFSSAKIIYNTNNGALFYNATASTNPIDSKQIGSVTNLIGIPSLSASDFVVQYDGFL